jgi:hypothetical protein
MRLRKGPVIAAFYPVGFLLLQLALAFICMVLVAQIIGGLAAGFGVSSLGIDLLGWGLGVFAGWRLLWWFKARDHRLYAYYLMHDYAYSARERGAYPSDLECRISVFANLVGEALQSDVDEVLLVGHSSGVHVGISLLADLLRQREVSQDGPAIGFLSLGQVVPMQSFLPRAERLRTDLTLLSACKHVTWIDVTAPGDGCTFALCDPVAVSGIAQPDKLWPLVISAEFSRTLTEARWKELRRRFFRLHFQYLCAFDQPVDYDYFRITAGPLTLAARFAGRGGSPSRKETAVSKFTSVLSS